MAVVEHAYGVREKSQKYITLHPSDAPRRKVLTIKTVEFMKTIKLRGGFHNCPPVSLRVSEQAYQNAVDSGQFSPESSGPVTEWANTYLTNYQLNKIETHFCGITGCLCGGIARGVYFELE